MTNYILIDEGQFLEVLSALARLKDTTSFWERFLVSAAPVFFGAVLGLAFGFSTDWLKTRRENRKIIRERQESELAQLSGVMTAIGFNIETLIHTVVQQILPHHRESHAALSAIMAVEKGEMTIQKFDELLHSEFRPMMTRSPEPHFIGLELFNQIPFIVAKDPELLKLSGWIGTFSRNLKSILSERNKIIDLATLGPDLLDFEMIRRQAATQATIADREVVDSFQLFEQTMAVSKKLETVISQNYKDVFGPKLKVEPPELLQTIMDELRRLSNSIVPEWPPSEPSVT